MIFNRIFYLLSSLAYAYVMQHDAIKSPSPPIQKKLEEWKPPSPSKDDIENRVSEADRRRQKKMEGYIKKNSVHNVRVDGVLRTKREEERERGLIVERKLNAKLARSTEKKISLTSLLTRKLTKIHGDKRRRADRAKKEKQQLAQAREEILDRKLASAVERKEQLVSESVQGLSDKIKTKMEQGKEVIKRDKKAAQEREDNLEKKLALAAERKEQIVSESAKDLTEKIKSKSEKTREVKKRDEEAAQEREENLEKKLTSAAERKEQIVSESKKDLLEKMKSKSERAQQAKKREEEAAQATEMKMDHKLALAAERKEQLVAESSQELSDKIKTKRCRADIARQRASAIARQLDVDVEARFIAACDRRDVLTVTKVRALSDDITVKRERVQAIVKNNEMTARELDAAAFNRMKAATDRRERSLIEKRGGSESMRNKTDRALNIRLRIEESARRLDDAVKGRLYLANARKSKLIADASGQAAAANRAKVDRASDAKKREKELSQRLREESDARLDLAAERKEEIHMKRTAASATKAVKTPGKAIDDRGGRCDPLLSMPYSPCSPPSAAREDLDRRLNDATERREAYLRQRSSRKPRPETPAGTVEDTSPTKANIEDRSPPSVAREDLDRRLNNAAERREAYLRQRSARKSRPETSAGMLKYTSSTKVGIEDRLNEAATRREALLMRRSEQAGSRSMRAEGRGGEAAMEYRTPIKGGTGAAPSASIVPMPQDGGTPAGRKGEGEVCEFHPAAGLLVILRIFHVGRDWILNVLNGVFNGGNGKEKQRRPRINEKQD